MKFLVRRTAQWFTDEGPPCEGAERESYIRIDERTTKDPAKIPLLKGESADWWYKEGRNHRVERGHIKRDFDAEGWFVEIPDLDALMAFYEENGRLIIQEKWGSPDLMQIEIYDSYRE